MRRVCRAFSATLPMWIGILGGFFIMCGGMEDAALWGILVAVFGVLVTAVVELVKSFNVTSAVKDDTTEMRPNVRDIQDTVHDTKALLTNTINPALQVIHDRTAQLDAVTTSIARFEGLVQGSKANEIRPDVLMAQFTGVYEERDMLKQRLSDAQKQIKILTAENHELRNRCYDLQHANDEYEYEP